MTKKISERKRTKVYINDVEVSMLENSTVLQACEKIGVNVPRFCYHQNLSIAGNCRMCLVEVKGAPKLQASCALPITEGMRVYTDSLAVRKAREGVMEFLLINHPLDCPICDQGGECDLQDQAMYYGSDHGRYNEYKRATTSKAFGPLIKTIMTRCIHCTRCVRFATEIAGCPEVGTIGRGSQMEISTLNPGLLNSQTHFDNSNVHPAAEITDQLGGVLDSELSGNLIDLCPVGALTSLPYAFVARPWECKSIESVDLSDAYCSPVKVDLRGQGPGSILRVLPRQKSAQGYAYPTWISDKTRFAYDGLKRQRLLTPLYKDVSKSNAEWTEISDEQRQTLYSTLLGQSKQLTVFIGNYVDYYTLQLLKETQNEWRLKGYTLSLVLINSDASRYQTNPYTQIDKFNSVNQSLSNGKKSILEVEPFTLSGLSEADSVLLIGSNPRVESPVLNTFFQKVAKNSKKNVGLIGSHALTLPYPVTHLGVSFASVLTLIDQLKSAKSTGYVNSLLRSKRVLVVLGSTLLYRTDTTALLNEISTLTTLLKENTNVSTHFLYHSVTEINAHKLGLDLIPLETYVAQTSKTCIMPSGSSSTSAYLYYNLPASAFAHPLIKNSLDQTNAFRIFVGSHGNAYTNKCHLLLPTPAYTEKESLYYNLFNEPLFSRVITAPLGKPTKDLDLFSSLLSI